MLLRHFTRGGGREIGTQSVRTRLGLPSDTFSTGTEQDIFRGNAVMMQEPIQLEK